MLSNILKWAFKFGEKEIHIFLEHDTSLEAVKEVAYQLIKHCGAIEEQFKAQKEAQEEADKAKLADPSVPLQESKLPPDVVD